MDKSDVWGRKKSNSNPNQEKYWLKLWGYGDGKLKERIEKTAKVSLYKVMLLMAIIGAFLIIMPELLLKNQWLWNRQGRAYVYGELMIYKWIAFGLFLSTAIWVLYLSPFTNYRRRLNMSVEDYVKYAIYEDPKETHKFYFNHLKDMKYDWMTFWHIWNIGFAFMLYMERETFMQIIPYQHEYLNTMPSVIPIAIAIAVLISTVAVIMTYQV